MRWFVSLTCLALAFSCSSIGCDSNGSGNGGSGGTGGAGGSGGGTGGMGGTAGTGGSDIRTCNNPHDCDDGEPCTTDQCGEDLVCAYESFADDTVCLSEIGLSICLSGVCQLIWPSCTEPGAEEGDFCEPLESPDPPRLGRCASGTCALEPCQIGFDCWDGDLCTSDICEGGECSHPNAPNGTSCGIVVPMVCVEGECVTTPD